MTWDNVELFGWFTAGILASVLVPVAVRWIKDVRDKTRRGAGDITRRLWQFAVPYIKLGIGSAIVAGLLLAIYLAGGGDASPPWYNAMLYGYAWNTTLETWEKT